MKKLFGIIMAVLVVVPFLGVKAIEGNYYTYTVGKEVNFYTYEGDTTGTRTIILSDSGADSQYVRTLVTGILYTTSSPWVDELDLAGGIDPADFKQVRAYKELQGEIQQRLNGASYIKDVTNETSLLTLDDLITIFGATLTSENVYTLDWAKWGSVFTEIETSAPGLYTQTVTQDKKNIWVIKFQRSSTDISEITGATVEQIPIESGTIVDGKASTTYAYMPVVYMDKTYDCHERDAQDKFACYECGEDIKWYEIGTQPKTCSLIENVKAESSCVKNIKTGVDQYFIQFGLIAGVCALALVAVNRKNLFRRI